MLKRIAINSPEFGRDNKKSNFVLSTEQPQLLTPLYYNHHLYYPTPLTGSVYSTSPDSSNFSFPYNFIQHKKDEYWWPKVPETSINILNLLKRETNYLADPSYLDVKNKLKLKYEFRSDLIRLMQTLSNEFKYHGETLFMATNFLDRYFQNLKTVTKKNLNLVPLTCIYISSKLNEENKEPVALDYINYSLEFLNSNNLVKFCSFFNNEFFSEKNLKDFEKKVLKDLNFNVSIVTPHAFVDEILSLFPELFNKKQKIYLMDRCEIYFASSLFDCRFLKYKPSILAASTLLIVYEKFPEVVRCCSDESLVKLLNFNSTDIEAFKFCKKGLSNIIPSTI